MIGVVSALTIPNLITNYQKRQTASRLKLVYSQLNEAIRLAEVENDDLSGWNFEQSHADSFEQYLLPHMKIMTKTSSNNLYNDGIYYKRLKGDNTTQLWVLHTPVNIYTTINGTDLILATTNSTGTFVGNTGFSIYIDLNGIKTPPNQFGKDMFSVIISSVENKRLYFYGTYSTSEFTFESEPNTDRDVLLGNKLPNYLKANYEYACSKNEMGAWCGRLIQVDGWEIRKDYPW